MRVTRNQKYRIPGALVEELCGWVHPSDHLAAIKFLKVLGLEALPELDNPNRLDDDTVEEITLQLHRGKNLQNFIGSVVVASDQYGGS